MIYWLALRELFICTVIVVVLGGMTGFMVMRGEYQGNADKEGNAITIVCDKGSIFAIQKHIEKITQACPEIATWKSAQDAGKLRENDRPFYEAGLWEDWPASPPDHTHGRPATRGASMPQE